MKRRKFISRGVVGAMTTLLPTKMLAFSANTNQGSTNSLRFGMIADVHKDLMPDADFRLEQFISEAQHRELDFIIQMGDFCHPIKENNRFLSLWQKYGGPKYHVLGNHDMDKGSKQQVCDFWGIEKPYYSFDKAGIHFIVLDANFLYKEGKFIDYEHSNFYVDSSYRTFISPEQIEWVRSDIDATDNPVIVFSHQSLLHYFWGVKNRMTLQEIFEEANRKADFQKVIACFNGHDHIDFHREINKIHYIEVNSASYQWISEAKSKERYPPEYYDKYPHLENMATYKEPLFAFVTVDLNGTLQIEGVQSEWMPPDPSAAGTPEQVFGSVYSPGISDRIIRF
ncbi:MAG: metallophosphoesterase family protein [Cyclobacteriaceae bacterium]